MSDRQLSSLLYRDNVVLKHAPRDRLQKEIEDAQALEDSQLRQANAGVLEPEVSGDQDPVVSALLAHLLQAGRQQVGY